MSISVHIIAIGKNKDSHLQALIDDYTRRMSWRVTFTELPIPNVSDAERKGREAELIRAAISDKSVLIVLDERGDNPDSIIFAKKLEQLAASQSPQFCFVIGGADGLDESLRAQAQLKLSFGKLTWPHMLVRLMLVEQLYRAQTILSNHPYHRL